MLIMEVMFDLYLFCIKTFYFLNILVFFFGVGLLEVIVLFSLDSWLAKNVLNFKIILRCLTLCLYCII